MKAWKMELTCKVRGHNNPAEISKCPKNFDKGGIKIFAKRRFAEPIPFGTLKKDGNGNRTAR